ncbi:uncharacterized protein LOC126971325 isoform X2 [Leptidea sinapis]|uniref:uncharacterized protein LOC126971325 isoform X2 n=1 Tax=Leptidea sinapis TaxID=189913 RepID=UPI0021C49DDD|nr:uncharacterized protein LOC126971325 isoform X2 [Leptidea sinapis]
MERGEGMIAIVRGLKDASLAVTLLDGDNKYTLKPDNVSRIGSPPVQSSTVQCENLGSRSDSGVQATDGLYASTYKIMHCHVTPTSPLRQVTEFPPQRAELSPGQGNFEIGGCGSGERHRASRSTNYRGGLSWPERGSVYSPRPSPKMDAFASSLRKYPSLSPERSSEIVERLVNFAQSRNAISKNSKTCPDGMDSDSSQQNYMLDQSRNCAKTLQRNYEPRVVVKSKRPDENQPRERWDKRNATKEFEFTSRGNFGVNNEVRYLRDVARTIREDIRNVFQIQNQPDRLSPRERSSPERTLKSQKSGHSVINMETQAAVEMVSKEIVAMPTEVPSQRTVAVAAIPSSSRERLPGATSSVLNNHWAQEASQPHTIVTGNKDGIKNEKYKHKNIRLCRSLEEIRYEKYRSKKCLPDQRDCHDGHKNINNLRNEKHCHRIKKPNKTTNSDFTWRFQQSCSGIQILDNVDESPKVKSQLCNINYECEADTISEIIQNWLGALPLKPIDYFSRPLEKEYLFYDLFKKLERNANMLGLDEVNKLKDDIIEVLHEFPVEVTGNKDIFLERLANLLIVDIKKSKRKNNSQAKHGSDIFNGFCCTDRYIPPTEDELRKFLTDEVRIFLRKSVLKFTLSQRLELTEDIFNVASHFMDSVHSVNEDIVKQDIVNILVYHDISAQVAIHFANILIKHLKRHFINQLNSGNLRSDTIIVLPNISSTPTPFNSKSENIEGSRRQPLKESNVLDSTDSYTQQLSEQITKWLKSVEQFLPQLQEPDFNHAIVQDLINDILDRQRYLQLHPSNLSTAESELDHLKFQIFKWMNDNNFELLERAEDLMQRINKIPVPSLPMSPKRSPTKFENPETSLGHAKSPHEKGAVKTSNDELNAQQTTDPMSVRDNQNNDTRIPIRNTPIPVHDQINEEYSRFLQEWVQKIPILTSTADEEALASKARIGIINGIYQANNKIRSTLRSKDQFLLEDMLDDEIEDLLSCLPQTFELKSKKHALKIELITKTVDLFNKLIDESYKERLAQNVDASLQKQGLKSPLHPEEEIQVRRVVDNFILFTKYRDNDKIRSEVYRRRLLNVLEELIDEIKKNHTEVTQIDYEYYLNDIVNVLQQVPVPDYETFNEEADIIALEMEIEKWYNDLPIPKPPNNLIELEWKKKIEKLAKKVHENNKKFESEDYRDLIIKSDLMVFLGEDIMNDPNININYVYRDFLERIKNGIPLSQVSRRVSFQEPENYIQRVSFQEPENYNQFQSNVPISSSLLENKVSSNEEQRGEYIKPQTPKMPLTSIRIDDENVRVPTMGPIMREHYPVKHNSDYNRKQSRQENNRSSIEKSAIIENNNDSDTQWEKPKYYDLLHAPPFAEISDRTAKGNEESYKLFSEERPLSSSLKEPSNIEWHTIPTSFERMNQQRHQINPARRENFDQYNEPKINGKSNNKPAGSGIAEKRNGLHTSQVAGPSGYKHHQQGTSSDLSRKQNIAYGERLYPKNYRLQPPYVYPPRKFSIQIQTPAEAFNEEGAFRGTDDNIRTVATNTSARTPSTRQPEYSNEPKIKRSKQVPDKDGARKYVELDSSEYDDDDDQYRCRCIERFWKYGRRARYYCDGLDMQLPPCMPFMCNFPRYF